MFDIIAQFDILGVATLLGALLFLGGLVWVLLDNRSFEEVSRRHAAAVEPKPRPKPRPATAELVVPPATLPMAPAAAAHFPADMPPESRPDAPDPSGGKPRRPGRPVRTRRAA